MANPSRSIAMVVKEDPVPAASLRASDSCRRRIDAHGFTLLEILLVVAFVGLMVGIVGPRLSTLYDRLMFSYRETDVLRQVNDLGVTALTRRADLRLSTQPPAPAPATTQSNRPRPPPPQQAEDVKLGLPSGWQIIAEPPIEYRLDGFCKGGRIAIVAGGRRSDWRLDSPHCFAKPVTAAP